MCNGKGGSGYGQQQNGAMGQPGFQPTPRVGQFPGSTGLPPALAGTGGVRSPAGPYGPPGFIGSVPAGGAQPLNSGNGVGTTMGPAGTGGLEPRPPNPSIWNPSNPKPGTPEWMTSPQGQQAQWQAAVGNSPFRAMYPNQGQYPQPHARPQPGPGEGYVSPNAGMSRQEAQAASQANWNNPQWVMQQVLAGKVAPQNNEQLQAMLANMSPADRDAYVAKYKSVGMDPLYQGGPAGSGLFGN